MDNGCFTYKSYFIVNVLLKLTHVYFVLAGNEAHSLIIWL